MRKAILATVFGFLCLQSHAQKFEDYFCNQTLRVDYLFSGNSQQQEINLDELSSLPEWAGRRHHLNEVPLAGNGDICMRDKESGEVIYRTSFSSLFQEWLGQPEAQTVRKGFENTFLLPFPKKAATVTIQLKNAHQQAYATLTHEVNPEDILIRQRGRKEITPHRYLVQHGTSEQCIDIAILAEGYTAQEMDLFYADAQQTCKALFAHEPFRSMQERFNIVAVASPSAESGVSIPRKGIWKSTAIHSHFDTFYADRYLTSKSTKSIHNWLAGIPYEHIIVLANTDTYGGGGIYNAFTLTSSRDDFFKPVVVHEFGHSFGGLADEYAYSDEPSALYPYELEPWEPNITTLVNFESKWKDMLPEGTPVPTPEESDASQANTRVGVYEGAGYTKKGIYRPATDCRMKTNQAPAFCPVCQRSLEQTILFYTE